MSSPVIPATPGTLDALVTEYLRVLAGERGASVHTLRAYGRELHGFAAWIAGTFNPKAMATIAHKAVGIPITGKQPMANPSARVKASRCGEIPACNDAMS